MTDAELEHLLTDLESDRVERKQSLSDSAKIRQTVCAFANDLPNHGKPGVLFIGAKDDGSCANLPITDQLLLSLSDIRSDGNTVPFPAITVQKRTLHGCELAVAIVQPSDAPPIRYQGRVWVRVGPRLAPATPEEERRLSEKRRSRDLPFDATPVWNATLEDLDPDLFRSTYLPASVAPEILEENQRSPEQQMESLRLITRHDGVWYPTVLGLLVAGTDPRRCLPGAYVQFLRVDGTELSDPIPDSADFSAPLPQLIRILEDKLEAAIHIARDPTAAVEVPRPNYPITAIRQLVRNALLHRNYHGTHAPVRIDWYSDRVEIQSPGGPYGRVTSANFGTPGVNDYRNPHLAEAMKHLNLVQKFGVGIQIARKEMERNGNPPPEFLVEDTRVVATLRCRS